MSPGFNPAEDGLLDVPCRFFFEARTSEAHFTSPQTLWGIFFFKQSRVLNGADVWRHLLSRLVTLGKEQKNSPVFLERKEKRFYMFFQTWKYSSKPVLALSHKTKRNFGIHDSPQKRMHCVVWKSRSCFYLKAWWRGPFKSVFQLFREERNKSVAHNWLIIEPHNIGFRLIAG